MNFSLDKRVWIAISIATLALLLPSAAQAQGIENSAAGLKSQLEAILAANKSHDKDQMQSLVSALKMPADSTWFSDNFGLDKGVLLSSRYDATWKLFRSHILDTFEVMKKQKAQEADVKDASGDGFASIFTEAKAPFAIYSATSSTKKLGPIHFPGYYVYDRGGFRCLDLAMFSALPNQPPMRIRVGANVAAASLIRQVPPHYPGDARSNHIEGAVVLHAIISRDGAIARLEYVSGPAELMQATIDAVRQWRYKPTLLDGEPVEVDTTIRVTYSLR